jgi:hypothetical protein
MYSPRFHEKVDISCAVAILLGMCEARNRPPPGQRRKKDQPPFDGD